MLQSNDALNTPSFLSHLNIIGLALLASSMIYLLAANWWMLADPVQIAIPQVLLLLCAVGSVYFSQQHAIRQSLDAMCALMLGLSLAVIGQVYQTGADSYLLFLLWSILLLPWLGRTNIGVFSILSLVSQVALMLFFKQTFWSVQYPTLFVICLNILALLNALACLKYYPVLRYPFLAFFALISFFSMFSYVSESNLVYLASALFLPVLSILYFYIKKQALGSSLAALTLGISITIWLVVQILEHGNGGVAEMLLFLAMVIFGWFGLISLILMRLLPKTRFHVIPLAFGAWLAGVLLAAALLVNWEQVSLVLGIFIIIVSAFGLKSTQNFFLRQLAYCLLICGQVALIWHSYDLTQSMWLALIIQVAMLLLSLLIRSHWLFVSLQMIGCYVIAQTQLWEGASNLNDESWLMLIWSLTALNVVGYSLLFFVEKIPNHGYRRSVIFFILVIVMLQCAKQYVGLKMDLGINQLWGWFLILPLLWVGLSYWRMLKSQLHPISAIAVLGLAVILSLMGYIEIYLLLLILAYSLQSRDKLMQALAIVTFIFLLWQLYYNLQLSFLMKSLSIFISGLAILVLHSIIRRFQPVKALAQPDPADPTQQQEQGR